MAFSKDKVPNFDTTNLLTLKIKLLAATTLILLGQFKAQTSVTPQECIAPFYHGVASGDPLSDRVIIWTRVTPVEYGQTLTGTYQVATDDQFTNVVANGSFSTDSTKDFTVKIDVTGLNPNTFYYYEFEHNGAYSLVGRNLTTEYYGRRCQMALRYSL